MIDLLILTLRYGGFLITVLCLIGVALAAVQYRGARRRYHREAAWHFGGVCLVMGLIGVFMTWLGFAAVNPGIF